MEKFTVGPQLVKTGDNYQVYQMFKHCTLHFNQEKMT